MWLNFAIKAGGEKACSQLFGRPAQSSARAAAHACPTTWSRRWTTSIFAFTAPSDGIGMIIHPRSLRSGCRRFEQRGLLAFGHISTTTATDTRSRTLVCCFGCCEFEANAMRISHSGHPADHKQSLAGTLSAYAAFFWRVAL